MKYQSKQSAIAEYLSGLQETPLSSYLEGLISYAESKFSFIQAVTDYHLAASTLSVFLGDPDYFEKQS